MESFSLHCSISAETKAFVLQMLLYKLIELDVLAYGEIKEEALTGPCTLVDSEFLARVRRSHGRHTCIGRSIDRAMICS